MYAIKRNRAEMIKNFFGSDQGFGNYRKIAIKLLRKTIKMLNKYDIKYMLISGTLLGYVRHNDFIPWDDDIDLIVDKTILTKIGEINKECEMKKIKFIEFYPDMYKSFFRMKGVKDINIRGLEYTWPFIDLFIYDENEQKDKLIFFKKEWEKDKFYPVELVNFLGIDVNIPKDPHYFLRNNYNDNYMTILHSGERIHKYEKPKKNRRIKIKEYRKYMKN